MKLMMTIHNEMTCFLTVIAERLVVKRAVHVEFAAIEVAEEQQELQVLKQMMEVE